MGLQHGCCYGWLPGERIPRGCNTADLREPGCLQERFSAYNGSHTSRHWVPVPKCCSKRALDTELQAAHVSVNVKCYCFKKPMKSGLRLCLSRLLTRVTQLLVLGNVRQMPGANETSDLTPIVKVRVETGSLAGLAPSIAAFMCMCACVPVISTQRFRPPCSSVTASEI